MQPEALLKVAVYADATRLVGECLRSFLPPARVSVAAYAATHRYLTNEGGGFTGRWSHEQAPYLVAPMECLRSTLHLTTAIVGPGQCGKTEVAMNWFLHSVGADPAPMLWYMQTDPGLEAFVKARINPMIDAHPVMRANQGTRPVDDSLHFKAFRGMTAEFLSAIEQNMINKSAGRIVADEWDAYALARTGNVKALLDVRRQTFGRESMILGMSHPDLATGLDPARDWTRGIMSLYADSDRRTWWWRCPHCGAHSSPNPNADRVMVLDYPEAAPLDEIQDAARLLCPVNGCEIEDHHRRAMNLTGQWIGAGQVMDEEGRITGEMQARDIAGFWIVGVMSPFILGGIGALARSIAKARREFEISGDFTNLKTVMVKQAGVPFVGPRRVGSLDATTIADRAEPMLPIGHVPVGVRFLTAGVDVQSNRFEFLVRGWGVAGESWIIDHQRVAADPATSPADWDALFARLLDAAYPLLDADGVLDGRAMKLRCFAYDTGGAPGVTRLAYDAWRRWRQQGRVRMAGRFDGRDGWNVLPTKGMGSLNAPKLQTVYPDTQRKDRRAGGNGTVPQGQFSANSFKDDLAGQMEVASPAPWYVHFPAELRDREPPHRFFEQMVAEKRQPNGVWEKAKARNEALDLMVLSHVAAHLHGLARLRWDKPPAWAADPFGPARNPAVVDAPIVVPSPLPEATAAPTGATAAALIAVTKAPAAVIRRPTTAAFHALVQRMR
jgi:phage terminase large subunit GpA-like protein